MLKYVDMRNESSSMAGWLLTQDGEEDVDEEVGTAATLEENTQRREDDGKKNLANVAAQEEKLGQLIDFTQ